MIPLGVLGAAHVPAPSGSWSPTDLGSALAAWFDATDATTLTVSAGRVSAWNDKSGNSRHTSQGNASYHPYTGSRTIGGLNAIEWTDGISWAPLLYSGLSLPQPYTVAYVGKFDDLSGYKVAVSLGSGTAYATASPGTTWRIRNGTDLNRGTSDTNAHLFTSIHNGSSSAIRVDGTQLGAVGNAGTANPDRILLGGPVNTSNSASHEGLIGEVVIVSGALSGSDLTSLETYLADKWGL